MILLAKNFTSPVQRYVVMKILNVKEYWQVKFHRDQKNADHMR